MARAVSIKLEDAERLRLADLAARKKRTPHYLMREAVINFIDREEKRLSFIEEALEAWRDYEQTGRHLTLEDMEAWAEKLETNPAEPLPKWRV